MDALRETIPRRQWRAKVEAAWPDWRAALEWTLTKQGNILLGQRLVGALETAWWVLPDAEVQHWLRTAFEAADEMTPRNVRTRLNLALARFRVQHHRFKSCHAAAERALGQARDVRDDVAVARAEFLTGHSLVVLGHVAQGEKLLESALVGFRKLGARRSIGRTLASLALAREHAGDVATACALCADAVETLKTIEGDDGEIEHVSYLAELEFHAGNTEEALRLVNEALAYHRRLDERLHVVVDLSNAAAYLVALNRYDEAASFAREALDRAVREGSELWTLFALQHLAAIGALQKDGTHAPRLIGFVGKRISELAHQREYTEEQEYDRIIGALRTEIGDAELQRLTAEGTVLTQERAIAEALAI
ncbi:MAG: tetratricopeptide repeat protein [Candidatus Eremiobacteraeota bacterium]|nr:tetratricopeptide repeat protein [Candidatus Eremiobacteraeota bacterium]